MSATVIFSFAVILWWWSCFWTLEVGIRCEVVCVFFDQYMKFCFPTRFLCLWIIILPLHSYVGPLCTSYLSNFVKHKQNITITILIFLTLFWLFLVGAFVFWLVWCTFYAKYFQRTPNVRSILSRIIFCNLLINGKSIFSFPETVALFETVTLFEFAVYASRI